MHPIYPALKRVFDFSAAFLGIIFLLPLFALIALAVVLDSRGGAIYRQERLTHNGKKFTILKFRSMADGARKLQKKGVPLEKLITRVGRFTRRTHLDELPQLWNIVRGEMSVIGPRPLLEEWQSLAPKERLYCRTGLVCLERIVAFTPERRGRILAKLPAGSALAAEKDPYALDVYYCRNISPSLDLFILSETFLAVLAKAASVLCQSCRR